MVMCVLMYVDYRTAMFNARPPSLDPSPNYHDFGHGAPFHRHTTSLHQSMPSTTHVYVISLVHSCFIWLSVYKQLCDSLF